MWTLKCTPQAHVIPSSRSGSPRGGRRLQAMPTAGVELAEFSPAPSWGFLGAAHGWEPHSGLLFSARKDRIKPTLQHHRCPLGHL